MKPFKPTVATAIIFVVVGIFGILAITSHGNDDAKSLENRLKTLMQPLGLPEIPCKDESGSAPFVVLILGQSNAANHGGMITELPPPRIEFFQGRCFLNRGPSLGATGKSGSFLSLLAPRLQAKTNQKLVFATLAVESTSIKDWTAPTELRSLLVDTLSSMSAAGLAPDIVLWQQGEADAIAGTDSAVYFAEFQKLLETLRAQYRTKVITALSTRCRNNGGEAVRTALIKTAERGNGVLIGPDTDLLSGHLRDKDCHFSVAGLEAAARLWEAALIQHLPR